MQDNQGKITGTSIIDRDSQASFSLIIKQVSLLRSHLVLTGRARAN
jgi:hypothetical protein